MDQGSIRISGTYLYIADPGGVNEWRYSGDVVKTPVGAKEGSVWIYLNDLMYIDEFGTNRVIPTTAMSTVPGLPGSAWKDGTFLYWVGEASRKNYGHADIAHDDVTIPPYSDYSDHGNQYSYCDHDNAHDNTSHNDSHGNHYNGDIGGHDDWAHQDYYGDECHGRPYSNCDMGHTDTPYENSPHYDHFNYGDSHSDTAFNDSHDDNYSYCDHDDYFYAGYSDSGSHNNTAAVINPVKV